MPDIDIHAAPYDDPAADALRARIRRLRRPENGNAGTAGGIAGGIDTGPATAHEAITRQMVHALGEDLREIRSRLDTLFYALIGTVLLDIVGRVFGL